MSTVDLAVLVDAVGGDVELANELVVLFCDDSTQVEAQLTDAIARNDGACIERLAHRVKGSMLTLGAMDAGTVAAECEQQARRGDASVLATSQTLCATLAATRTALRAAVQHLSTVAAAR